MKSIILIAATLFTCNICGIAQMTPKQQAIKELFIVMHQDSLMNQTMNAMSGAMTATIRNPNSNDTAANNTMQRMMAKNMEATKDMVTKLINEDMVDVYDKYFTLQEIKDFTSFYKSKSGQQLLNKMPDITKDIMTVVATKYAPAMQQAMQEAGKTK
jgi:hypothetical protein